MTHLQAAPDRHEISSADGFWHKKNALKVFEVKIFQFRNKKQKCNTDFLLISFCAIKFVCINAFRRNTNLLIKTLHYSNKFNNHFIVCYNNLSFHFTMTLFLFKTHHNVLQMCDSTFNVEPFWGLQDFSSLFWQKEASDESDTVLTT